MKFDIDNEPSNFELDKIEHESFKSPNTKSYDSLGIYLNEIGEIELLSREEEINLALLISAAKGSIDDEVINLGRDARDKMILANLRLVVSVAKKYSYSHMDKMDLIQDGSMGLLKAVDKYQVDRGFRFSTFATWWIRQSISRSISDKSRNIRLPVYIHGMLSIVRKVKSRYYSEYGKKPDDETVSKISGISASTVRVLNVYSLNTFQIDQSINEEKSTYADQIMDKINLDPEKLYKCKVLEDYVSQILEELSERERDIIRMRYGIDTEEKTLGEIGKLLGVTRERVRQLESKALNKLRETITT